MKSSYKKILWTAHSEIKMRQYGLSKSKLIGILYKPDRQEEGIVPGTTAVMRTNPIRNSANLKLAISNGASKKFYAKAPGEVWLMYKDAKDQRKIISAWRYPGVSKPGDPVPIPEEIRQEIMQEIN